MEIEVTVKVPDFIYSIYVDAAKFLGGCTTEAAMSAALQGYAQYIFEEMQASGELAEDMPEENVV